MEPQPKKSTIAAYLLWLFLGAVGAHKFYLNRPREGFLYMFTFGLFGLGCLLDLFTLPLQVKHANMRLSKRIGSQLGQR